jgi:hypothetical protein
MTRFLLASRRDGFPRGKSGLSGQAFVGQEEDQGEGVVHAKGRWITLAVLKVVGAPT